MLSTISSAAKSHLDKVGGLRLFYLSSVAAVVGMLAHPAPAYAEEAPYGVSIRYTSMELLNDAGELARVTAMTADDPVAVIERRLGDQMSNNFSNRLTRDTITLSEGSVNSNYLGRDDFNEAGDFMLNWFQSGNAIDGAERAGGGVLRDGVYSAVDAGSHSTHLQALGDGGHVVGFRHTTGLGNRVLGPDFTTVDWYTTTAIAIRPDNAVIEVPHPSGNGYGYAVSSDGRRLILDNEASLHGVNSEGVAVGTATEQVNLFLDTWVNQEYSFTYNINTGETRKLPLTYDGGSDINDEGVIVGHDSSAFRSWLYVDGDEVPTIIRSSYSLPFGAPGPKINNRGQVFWPLSNDSTTYWEEGELKDVQDLTDEVSITQVIDINRVGQILVRTSDFSLRILSPSPLSLSVDPAPRILEIGETYVLKLRLDHTLPEAATYRFLSGPLEFDPAFFEYYERSDSLEALPEGQQLPDPGPIVLSASDASFAFDLPVKPLKSGATRVTSEVEVTLANGDTQVFSVGIDLLIEPLQAVFTIVEDQYLLNQVSQSEWGEEAKKVQADRLRAIAEGTAVPYFTSPEPEPQPFANLLEVKLELTNKTNQAITNVSIPAGVEDILSLIKSRDLDRPGVPLFPVRFIGPNGEIDDLTLSGDDISLPLLTIADNETKTFTWIFEAYDANPDPLQDDSANLIFEPLVLGTLPAAGDLPEFDVRLLLESEIDVIDKPLLKWGILPRDGRTDYLSGQAVRVDGFIENISAEDGSPPRDLLVMVYPTQEGNLGGGFTRRADSEEFPRYYEIYELPGEGPGSRVELQTAFQSFATDFASTGKVAFGVRVWIKNEDGSLTGADGQVIVDSEWKDEFFVLLRGNPALLTAAQQRREECALLGISPFLCGFNEGIIDFSNGIYGLGKFLLSTAEGNLNIYKGIIAYEKLIIKSLFDAAMGEPNATDELFRESYAKYTELVELGVMAGEGVSNVPMAFNAFSIQAGEAMSGFLDAAFKGDLEEVQFQIGDFLGANPDLLVEPLMVGMTYSRLVRSAAVAEARIGSDVIAAQRKANVARLSSSLDNRIAAAAADPAVTDLSSALEAGDKLNPNQLLRVFGVDEEQLGRIQDIAENFGVMISFRSRAPLARDLLKRGLAWPKPQGLKFKTVNDIDIKYLGYRNESKAILEIQQPPSSLINKTDDALEDALDDYMDELIFQNGELASNDVLAGEVRKRLKVRAEEWNELAPKLKLSEVSESTIDLPTNFEANLQFGTAKERDLLPDIHAAQSCKVRTTPDGVRIDPVTNQPQRRWQLDMSNTSGEDFRAVSGDIDFMAILEPDGSMIRDAKRRLQIYEQLASAVDMQHGESFTFFIDKARKKYLDGNTFGEIGAEALCTIAPFGDQTPTAAYFVKNLSILEDGVNSRFLPVREVLSKAARFKIEGGRIRYVPGKKIVTRRSNVTGEYVVMAGAEINSMINLDFVNTFKPYILKRTLRGAVGRALFYLPRLISTYTGEGEDSTATFTRGDPAPGPLTGFAWTLAARADQRSLSNAVSEPPLLQLEIHPDTAIITPKVWTEGNGWEFITGAEAIALGQAGILDMRPMSHLKVGLERGQAAIEIADLEELEVTGEFFRVGDRVVIAPGTEYEEFATLQSVEPFALASGTIYAHASGTLIASLGRDTTDRDGDGLNGAEEVAFGSDPDRFDTDGDGFGDGDELSTGDDPLVAARLALSSAPLFDPADGPEFRWPSREGYLYELLGTTDLATGFWQSLGVFLADGELSGFSAFDYFPGSDRSFFRVNRLSTNDADGDGLSLREETGLGTDPDLADSDGDGLNDGLENYLDLDPLDAESTFTLFETDFDPALQNLSVQFPSKPGVHYYLEAKASLVITDWTIRASQNAFGRVSQFVVPLSELGDAQFFRVRADLSDAPRASQGM